MLTLQTCSRPILLLARSKFLAQKVAEIHHLLRQGGSFLLSYVNFDHVHKQVYERYSNVPAINELRQGLRPMFSN
jgi:hypothetical protein